MQMGNMVAQIRISDLEPREIKSFDLGNTKELKSGLKEVPNGFQPNKIEKSNFDFVSMKAVLARKKSPMLNFLHISNQNFGSATTWNRNFFISRLFWFKSWFSWLFIGVCNFFRTWLCRINFIYVSFLEGDKFMDRYIRKNREKGIWILFVLVSFQ